MGKDIYLTEDTAGKYPLTQAQRGVYFEAVRHPERMNYNLALDMRFSRQVDTGKLQQAVQNIVDAFPVFRTRICEEQGDILQYSDPLMRIEVPVEQLPEEAVQARIEQFVRPFDLEKGPLVRFLLLETPQALWLVQDIHHIISDGTTVTRINKMLDAAYRGEALPEEEVTLYAYAQREQAERQSARYEAAAAYYRERFAGAEASRLPEKLSSKEGNYRLLEFHLDRGPVQRFCEENHFSAIWLFMSAFELVVSRLNRENKVVYTSPYHGRSAADIKSTLGMFVQTIPLLTEIPAEASVLDFIKGHKEPFFASVNHALYGFSDFSNEMDIKPELTFVYQGNAVTDEQSILGEKVYQNRLVMGKSCIGLETFVYALSDKYMLRIRFTDSQYSDAFVASFAQAMLHCVENMMADPAAMLRDVSIISAAEEKKLLELGTGEELAYDRAATFVDLFQRQAQLRPQAIAVVDEMSSLTYGELEEKSDALAEELLQSGVQQDSFVAVMLPRRKEFLISTIAVFKAGGAYIPFDDEYPTERLQYMLEDSQARVLITTKALFDEKQAEGDFRAQRVIFLDDFDFSRSSRAINHSKPDSLAYMIYTSGSTGRPKGVMIEHRGLRNFAEWLSRRENLQAGDRCAEQASFSFDASMFDLYPPLMVGGEVHILSPELRKDLDGMYRYFVENKIVGLLLTTQLGMEMLKCYDLPLRYLMVGGDRLQPTRPTAVTLYNCYGPTEFTVASSYYVVDAQKNYTNIPIGRPVPNSLSVIVDGFGNLMPRGMEGELCLLGCQMARGYWNLPDKTAAVFVDAPFAPGERMYRTGDLVRWNEEGNLEYIGRIDKQVKLRGFRIELGEIESAINAFPGIDGAVAAVLELNGAPQLCAYYTAAGDIDETKLQEHLSQSLTAYMVPNIYMRLDKLPLTPNGKVDRRALPMPELKAAEIIAPETEQEKQLFAIAAELLKTRDFGVTTNLLSMGLTSIGAIRLSQAVGQRMGLTLKTKDILQTPSIRQWAGCLQSGQEEVITYERREVYPLTENQLGVYIDWEQHRDSLQYNVPAAWKLSGIDPEQLRAALEKVLAAHPYLKVRFEVRDGQVMQRRNDEAAAEILLERLDSEPEPAFFQSRVRPFDLLKEKLYRMEIYAAPEHTYLFIDIHHTIYDGGSMGILQRGLAAACGGAELVPEVFSAYDYALGYQEWKESAAYRDAEAYFNGLVKGAESLLYPVSSEADGCSGSKTVSTVLPKKSIQRLCRDQGITANSFFIAALTQVLGRITREEKLLITTISNGRAAAKMADTMGMFVQTLPVVSRAEKGQTVAAVLQSMHQQLLETIERDKYPFTQLVEHHGIQPNIIFAYQGDVHENMKLGDGMAEPLPLALDTVKMPLAINVLPEENAYRLLFEYDSSLYTGKDIELLAGTVRHFAEEMSGAKPTGKIDSLPLLSAPEQQRLLTLGTGEALSYDTSETFVDLFKKQAQLRPQATAVVDADSSLTYSALDRASDALAAELLAEGVEQDSFVAVMLPRRKEFLISTIAVFKAGGAYIPFDDEYPLDRLQYMLEDSQAQVLITTKALFDEKQAEGDFRAQRVIFLDDFDFSRSSQAINHSKPDSLAYMIYTSGSTGRPKGVMIEHRGLRNFAEWLSRRENLQAGDRCAEQASFSFDASMFDLYPPLMMGGEVHILSSELRKDLDGMYRYFVENKIVGLLLTTQLGMEMLKCYDLPLRYLMVGGDRLQPTRPTAVTLYNCYGPTEFTVASSYYMVDAQKNYTNIPIGRPVPNSLSVIVDGYGNLMPRGMEGKLCLLGCQMARGYWNLPDKTAAAFVDAPFAPGERMYRTGDLVRWNEEGNLGYIGRIDKQVKLRGFRIELGEIESVLAGFPGIKDAVAAVQEIDGVQQLCAYYTAAGSIDEAMLKGYLAQSLTEYMVPAIYMKLAVLPLTPNGKVDRKALPLPNLDSLFAYVAPSNEIEKKICAVYSKILHREQVGVLDDFFALGGTSLSAMRAIIELSNAGCSISYGTMFQCRTPQAIAALLQDGEAEKQEEEYFNLADYDYTAIQRLLDEPEPDLWNGFELRPYGRILLTGATGYLGIHLLHYLLLHTDSEICCLVREKKGITAAKRLYGLLVYYFEDQWEKAFTEKVKVVLGDITDADLSEKLQGEPIDTVFNCAAIVKHYAANDIMDRVNVDGVRQLIALCEKKKALLVQTSTYSIGGDVEEGMANLLTERNLYIGQQTDNRYVLTKFQAERLVLQAAAEGRIQAKIMRMGNLMGRESDGEFQVNMNSNAFAALLKSFKVLGLIPLDRMNAPIEISPIDRSAEAVALLARTPGNMAVFHTYNNYQVNLAVIVKAFNDYGYPIEVISQERFAAKVSEFMHDPAKAMYMQGLLHNGKGNRRLLRVKPDNGYTARILYRLGFYWTPTHGSYMRDFIEMLDGLGFFEEN